MVVSSDNPVRIFVCPVHRKPRFIAHGPRMVQWMIVHAPCMDYDLDHMGRDEAEQWAIDHLAAVSKAVGFVPESDEAVADWAQTYPGDRWF